MTDLITDLLAYLKAVFGESWQKAFTLFDILGVVLFVYPRIGTSLVGDESLARAVGGLIFLSSYSLANFSLYRQLAGRSPWNADIRLDVVQREFSHSLGTRRFPDREVQNSPHGFGRQGLPDWGSLWAYVRIANHGYERGQLEWELDEVKTRLPSLFDVGQAAAEFYPPVCVGGRRSSTVDFFFDVLFATEDPRAFAQALGNLIRSKEKYRVALLYWTSRVDGRSGTRRLCIEGDFQGFYQKVLEYWDGHGFNGLADLARSAA